MKIICTEIEKSKIINALMNYQYCPHSDDISNYDCTYDISCRQCIKSSIEWQIEEDKSSSYASVK